MADSVMLIKDANGSPTSIDVHTTPAGDKRQVVLVGDGDTDSLISPATEGTLALLLTELAQKLEANDLAALSTSAKQDQAKSVLDNIFAAVDGLEALTGLVATAAKQDAAKAVLDSILTSVDGVEALLTQIRDGGVFAYRAGAAAASIDVPTGAKLRKVSVLPGAGDATLQILGGDVITVKQDSEFDEVIPGTAAGLSSAGEVVIGGVVESYYVAWTA